MELVIRKYFWAVNLCFVALVALVAAKTVNLFFEAAIAPAPSAPTARGSGRAAQEAPATLDLAKLAQITNLPLPSPRPDDEATEAGHERRAGADLAPGEAARNAGEHPSRVVHRLDARPR